MPDDAGDDLGWNLADLPPALRRTIEDRAAAAGVSVAEWIRAAIRATAEDEAKMRADMETIEMPPPSSPPPPPSVAPPMSPQAAPPYSGNHPAPPHATAPDDDAYYTAALQQALTRLEQALERRERQDELIRQNLTDCSEPTD